MIYYADGDILTNDYKIFCHQVNCQKVMGAGLAKQIKDKYPEVYQIYQDREYPYLGAIDWIPTSDNRICVNMYAQDFYGRDRRYTDYIAFVDCLNEIENEIITLPKEWSIAFPYGIGCGLGGGDWRIIEELLKDFSKRINQDVIIVRK